MYSYYEDASSIYNVNNIINLENSQHGWCDSPGTIDEVRAKLQMRQEGALKRERAIAYSRFQQVMKLNMSPS